MLAAKPSTVALLVTWAIDRGGLSEIRARIRTAVELAGLDNLKPTFAYLAKEGARVAKTGSLTGSNHSRRQATVDGLLADAKIELQWLEQLKCGNFTSSLAVAVGSYVLESQPLPRDLAHALAAPAARDGWTGATLAW